MLCMHFVMQTPVCHPVAIPVKELPCVLWVEHMGIAGVFGVGCICCSFGVPRVVEEARVDFGVWGVRPCGAPICIPVLRAGDWGVVHPGGEEGDGAEWGERCWGGGGWGLSGLHGWRFFLL